PGARSPAAASRQTSSSASPRRTRCASCQATTSTPTRPPPPAMNATSRLRPLKEPTMSDELAALDATAQADLIRRRALTPRELVDAAIGRIERLNPQLNAVIHPLYEKARAAAAGPLPDGPFRGVPLLLKDLLAYTAGDPHHLGARPLRDAGFVAPHDSYLAEKLRAAGFVVVGRTNTPELGT